MGKTHGNCAVWSEENATHVFCKCDMLPGCWYSKNGNSSKCCFWRRRITELHLETGEIVADFYEGSKEPISAVARCSDGNRYAIGAQHLMQAKIAGWGCRYYVYTEGEVRYVRQTWTGTPLKIVVQKEKVL